jgi:hypothetical protein
MLDEAGNIEGTPESLDVFIRGKDRAGRYLSVDLTKDEIALTQDQVNISTDIDSVIWVTYAPKFKGPMNLHLLPVSGDKPPFSVNNHVYVKVLDPPTPEDRIYMRRSQMESRLPLSNIPHAHFGQIGQGQGQFNVYVFFPRMIHRNLTSRRMKSLVPREVLELWISEVVIPACRTSLTAFSGFKEYLPETLRELQLKAGNRHRQQIKTIPISSEALATLQTQMRQTVRNKYHLLGRFGSFFFVVDARGTKLLAKQHAEFTDPYGVLTSMVPELDWDHMLDRSCGELYLDLGISFHPAGVKHLVGLWRLPKVQMSHEMMGLQKGRTHHLSLLSEYGGKQAEMKKRRSARVHLCFRSTYNLCFEVVRQPGQSYYICTDQDALRANQKFLDGCSRWKHLFRMARSQDYGVRDEVRGSARAILDLQAAAIQKVVPIEPPFLSNR